MPLDQSIVFDGAWRLLRGQVPYRDFVLPNGLAPIALQAAAFAILGVTWKAFLLHAALLNGVFAAMAFALLRVLGLGTAPALVYGAGAAVVFYTPFGVPFMDQHAFFFSFACVLAAVRGARAETGPAALGWGFALGTAFLAAAASKQLPTALLPIPLAAAWLALRPRAELLRGAALAVAGLGLGLVAIAAAAGVSREAVETYALALPGGVGRERLAVLSAPGELARTLREVHRAWGLWSVDVALAGTAAALLFGARRRAGTDPGALAALLLAPALLAVCLAHATLTLNQPHNAIPYAFVALGLLHLGLGALVPGRAGRRALAASLLAIAARDAWDFETRVNVPRRVHKLDRAAAPLHDHPALPPALRPMAWWTPSEHAQTPRALADTAAFLRGTGARFFLLGDSSVLYALAGQPSAGRALWFHAGLTFPRPGTPAFAGFERALLQSIARHRVEYVVLEGDRTYMRTTLADFPALEERLRRVGCDARRFGVFTVIRLCAPS